MLLLLSLLISTMSVQQPAPVCDRLANDEVAGLIGPITRKNAIIGPDTCVWSGDRQTFSVMRAPDLDPESANGILDAVKARAREGDTVRDEPGIGTRAVSEATARGTRVAIIAVSGRTAWTIAVDHVYSGLKADDLLPKLRAVAKKLVTP